MPAPEKSASAEKEHDLQRVTSLEEDGGILCRRYEHFVALNHLGSSRIAEGGYELLYGHALRDLLLSAIEGYLCHSRCSFTSPAQ